MDNNNVSIVHGAIKKFTLTISFLWFVAFFAQSAAAATTYYVDNSCSTSGNGATQICGASGPFRTISAAITNPSLTAGDTVKIRATGTDYVEGTITPSAAGTAASPITVTRYDGDTGRPVWARSSSVTMLNADRPYWIFDNIKFQATSASNDIVQVRGTNVTFRNCDFIEGGYAISIGDTGDNLMVDGCTFDGNGNGVKHSITSGRFGNTSNYVLTGIVIRNSTFTNGDQDYIQWLETSGACRLATVTGIIENNTFIKGPLQIENAIDIKTTGLASDPLIMRNNQIAGWTGSSNDGRPVVIQHCAEYTQFLYNTVDGGPSGLTCAAPCEGINIQADAGLGGASSAAIRGIKVIGNVFRRMRVGIDIGAHDTTLKLDGAEIYNNTFDQISSQAFLITTSNAAYTNSFLRNNLTYRSNSGGTSAPSGWTFSNNGWFSTPCGGRCGANDLTGTDPLFVDAANGVYQLQAASPAIDKGINVGLAYSGAAPDLGAYETTGGPPPSPPSIPSSLAATSISTSQINLSWVDVSNETSYKIERCQGSSCTSFAEIATVGANIVSYQNTGLSAATSYSYRIRASNSGGDSGYSNTASATTLSLPSPPVAPSSLAATAFSSSQINLSWADSSTNEDGFKIERCQSAGCTSFVQIATVGANATSYQNTGLVASTAYSYRVRSYNAGGGDSSYSNTASATTPTAPTGGTLVFAAGGDHGQSTQATTQASLAALASQGAAFYLAVGDMSYDAPGTETAWCNFVKSYVGSTFPFQIVSGNHEDDAGSNGFIGNFAACLPDRMGSTGTYGAEYYFDSQGLARIIMISPNLSVNGTSYNYTVGSARYNWLSSTIDAARAAGIPWIVVGMHKNCITMGTKSCEIGEALMDLLISKQIDLVLQGHDHTYQRSKQLSCANAGSYLASCVADDGLDNAYAKGAGTVFVIDGSFGRSLYAITTSDSEAGYFAKWMGNNINPTFGFTKYTLTATQLTVQYVPASDGDATPGIFTDSFTITSGPPPSPPSAPTSLSLSALSAS